MTTPAMESELSAAGAGADGGGSAFTTVGMAMTVTLVSAVRPPALSAARSADVLPYSVLSRMTTDAGSEVATWKVTSTTGAVAFVVLLPLVLLPPKAVVLFELPLDGGGLGGGGLGGGDVLLFAGGDGGGELLLPAGGGDGGGIWSRLRRCPVTVVFVLLLLLLVTLVPLVLLLLVALLLLFPGGAGGRTSETLVTVTAISDTFSCIAMTPTKASDTFVKELLL